jgi:hypothetical protein
MDKSKRSTQTRTKRKKKTTAHKKKKMPVSGAACSCGGHRAKVVKYKLGAAKKPTKTMHRL